MPTVHLSPSQATTLAIAFSVAIVKNTPPGVSAADYFIANKHLWSTHEAHDIRDEKHSPEQDQALRPRSDGPSEHGDRNLSRQDEDVYKRQLGNMMIKMELLKSQHQVEMESLRCHLEATGRKRKKRLALDAGEEEMGAMELEPSQRSYRPQEDVVDCHALNDFGDHSTDVSSAFVVLKNMSLLQHNMRSLSLGRDQARWMFTPLDHENMVHAATSSMSTVISVLTRSVVAAVNSLVNMQTEKLLSEFYTSLERYRTHMSTIQECLSSFESDSEPSRRIHVDLERSWLELLNLVHAHPPILMSTDVTLAIVPELLASLFITVLCSEARPDLPMDTQTFLVNGFVRIILKILIERLGQAVVAERASVPIEEESRLRSSTRSSTKAKVRTRLRVGHLALRDHCQGLCLKKECGWIVEQFVAAVKRPISGRLVYQAFCQDVLMHGDLAFLVQKLSSFVQLNSPGPDTRLSPGWLTEMLIELLVILPS